MKKILYLCLLFVFMSCATVDVEKTIRDSGTGKQDGGTGNIPFVFSDLEPASEIIYESPGKVGGLPKVIYAERPVFISEAELMSSTYKKTVHNPLDVSYPSFTEGQDKAYAEILLDKTKEAQLWRKNVFIYCGLFLFFLVLFFYFVRRHYKKKPVG